MNYSLGLPERPFNAIKVGTKKVEGRKLESISRGDRVIQAGDTIMFTNKDSGELMEVKVIFVHHYPDVRSMLEIEGVENVLSSGGTIEDGIKGYNSFAGYEASIAQSGIYAIGVKSVKSDDGS